MRLSVGLGPNPCRQSAELERKLSHPSYLKKCKFREENHEGQY